MSTSQHRILITTKTFIVGTALALADYWLWPQLNSERLVEFDNITQTVVHRDQDFELMYANMDDFFDQWDTHACIQNFEMNCNFYIFIATYLLYTFGTFMLCLALHSAPRFGLTVAVLSGSSFNLYHQYIVRGRFVAPDSLGLWGAQFGSFTGPTLWGCLCFLCETPPSPPMVGMPAHP